MPGSGYHFVTCRGFQEERYAGNTLVGSYIRIKVQTLQFAYW